MGAFEDWMTGVNIAKGVANQACPDRVLIFVACAGPCIPAKGVFMYYGSRVALSLITLKPLLNLPYIVPLTLYTAYTVGPYLQDSPFSSTKIIGLLSAETLSVYP